MTTKSYHTLRLLLGDQLNEQHSWFDRTDEGVLYVLMEIRPEATYVRHHIQKVVGFFVAMRHFAAGLAEAGHHVKYIALDDPDNAHSFAANCRALIDQHGIQHLAYQEPDEWRLDQELRSMAAELGLPCQCVPSEHFYTEREELQRMFAGKKTYIMEPFYRRMREKHQVLMDADGKSPLTGRWNYDAENRKKMPASVRLPELPVIARDVSALVDLLRAQGIETIGEIDATGFDWPVTRAESLALLEHFVACRLAQFGDYQDSLTQRHWLLFHSRLSFSMNVKLISPAEVVNRCMAYWQAHPEAVPISALEGFVRQVIGWREYMRGIYWAEMPGYASLNYFGHEAALPTWFWTGQTKMRCLQHSITQSLERAYAHHIQRLMVTGNFSLLLGVHPDEVDAWYLGIYADAIQWVEITNTRGMSQFADGGIVGTKPYVSSANYVNKMGDYCGSCHYDHKARHGPKACPFNSLYWDFYDRHEALLRKNPRIGMVYRLWDKMDAEERAQVLERAAFVKAHIDEC